MIFFTTYIIIFSAICLELELKKSNAMMQLGLMLPKTFLQQKIQSYPSQKTWHELLIQMKLKKTLCEAGF